MIPNANSSFFSPIQMNPSDDKEEIVYEPMEVTQVEKPPLFSILEEDQYLNLINVLHIADSNGHIFKDIAQSFQLSPLLPDQIQKLKDLLAKESHLKSNDAHCELHIPLSLADIFNKNLNVGGKSSLSITFCGGGVDSQLGLDYFQNNLFRFVVKYIDEDLTHLIPKDQLLISTAFKRKIQRKPLDLDFHINSNFLNANKIKAVIDSIPDVLEEKTEAYPLTKNIFKSLKDKQLDIFQVSRSPYLKENLNVDLEKLSPSSLYQTFLKVNAFHKAENIRDHNKNDPNPHKKELKYCLRSFYNGKCNWDFVYPFDNNPKGQFPFHSLGMFIHYLFDEGQISDQIIPFSISPFTTPIQAISDKNARLITSMKAYEDIGASKIYFAAITQGYRCLELDTERKMILLILQHADEKFRKIDDLLFTLISQWTRSHWNNDLNYLLALTYNYSYILLKSKQIQENDVSNLWGKIATYFESFVQNEGFKIKDPLFDLILKAIIYDKISFCDVHAAISLSAHLSLHHPTQKRVFPTQHGRGGDSGEVQPAIQIRSENLKDDYAILFPYEPDLIVDQFIKIPQTNEFKAFYRSVMKILSPVKSDKNFQSSQFADLINDPRFKFYEFAEKISLLLDYKDPFLIEIALQISRVCQSLRNSDELAFSNFKFFIIYLLDNSTSNNQDNILDLLKDSFLGTSYEPIIKSKTLNLFKILNTRSLREGKIKSWIYLIQKLFEVGEQHFQELGITLKEALQDILSKQYEQVLSLSLLKSHLVIDPRKALQYALKSHSNSNLTPQTKILQLALVAEKFKNFPLNAEKVVYYQNLSKAMITFFEKESNVNGVSFQLNDQCCSIIIDFVHELTLMDNPQDSFKFLKFLFEYNFFNINDEKFSKQSIETLKCFIQGEKFNEKDLKECWLFLHNHELFKVMSLNDKISFYHFVFDEISKRNKTDLLKYREFIFQSFLREDFSESDLKIFSKKVIDIINSLISNSPPEILKNFLTKVSIDCDLNNPRFFSNILIEIMQFWSTIHKRKEIPVELIDFIINFFFQPKYTNAITKSDQAFYINLIEKRFKILMSANINAISEDKILKLLTLIQDNKDEDNLIVFIHQLKSYLITKTKFKNQILEIANSFFNENDILNPSFRVSEKFEDFVLDYQEIYKEISPAKETVCFGSLSALIAQKKAKEGKINEFFIFFDLCNIFGVSDVLSENWYTTCLNLAIKLFDESKFELIKKILNLSWKNQHFISLKPLWETLLKKFSSTNKHIDIVEVLLNCQKVFDIFNIDPSLTEKLVLSHLPNLSIDEVKKLDLFTIQNIEKTFNVLLNVVNHLEIYPPNLLNVLLDKVNCYGSDEFHLQTFSLFLRRWPLIKNKLSTSEAINCLYSLNSGIRYLGHSDAILQFSNDYGIVSYIKDCQDDRNKWHLIQSICLACIITIEKSSENLQYQYDHLFKIIIEAELFPIPSNFSFLSQLALRIFNAAVISHNNESIYLAISHFTQFISMNIEDKFKKEISQIISQIIPIINKLNDVPPLTYQNGAKLLSIGITRYKLNLPLLDCLKILYQVEDYFDEKMHLIVLLREIKNSNKNPLKNEHFQILQKILKDLQKSPYQSHQDEAKFILEENVMGVYFNITDTGVPKLKVDDRIKKISYKKFIEIERMNSKRDSRIIWRFIIVMACANMIMIIFIVYSRFIGNNEITIRERNARYEPLPLDYPHSCVCPNTCTQKTSSIPMESEMNLLKDHVIDPVKTVIEKSLKGVSMTDAIEHIKSVKDQIVEEIKYFPREEQFRKP